MQPDFQMLHHHGTDWCEWGSASRRPLVQLDMAHKGEWLDSVVGPHPVTEASMVYHVLRCELCICTHVWPLSTSEDLAYFYAHRFYQETKPHYLTEYAEDQEWWLAIHHTVFDTMQAWVPESQPWVLDVGAGPGYPLQVAHARGWRAFAIEPNADCRARLKARGIAVVGETLDSYAQAGWHVFDVIYCWETLEHQPNPEDFLLQCYELLAPGGVLVVAVPNDYSPGQLEACRRFNLPPWWVAPPDHQCYWTPVTLKLLLRRCGFAIRYIRMTYPLIEEFMLKEGLCYVGNPRLGRECHQKRMAFELSMINSGRWNELESLYIDNVEKRIGREIIIVATKA